MVFGFYLFFKNATTFFPPFDVIDEPTVERELEGRYLTTNWQSNDALMPCVLKPVNACSCVRKCCLFNVDCTFMRMFY